MPNEYPVAGLGNFSSINLLGITAGWIQFSVPATVTSYQIQWPAAQGSAGQQLQNNGSGVLSWADPAGGAVTTMAAVGSSPNVNAGTIAANTLTLQPADLTNPGVLTALAQTIGGLKTMRAPTATTSGGLVVQPTDHVNYDSAIALLNDGTAGRLNWLIASSKASSNQLEFFPSSAPDGSTFTNKVLSISAVGNLSTTGTVIPGNGIQGTTTNDNAVAGNVGEYMQTLVTAATGVPTSGQYGDLATIALTAGDWDVSAVVKIDANSATSFGAVIDFGIGTATGNSSAGMSAGVNATGLIPPTSASGWSGGAIPSYRISVASTTTYYLKLFMTYSTATPNYQCRLSARRVR